MDNVRMTLTEVRTKYTSTRQLVYEMVAQEFPSVVAQGISLEDAHKADRWKSSPVPGNRAFRSTWEWSKVYTQYQSRPDRFEISLWRNGALCALSFGKVSRSGNRVRLDLIEGTPIKPSPLGGPSLPILAFAAGAYASVIGASEVWVMDPLPELESLYRAEGFSDRIQYDRGSRIGQRRVL